MLTQFEEDPAYALPKFYGLPKYWRDKKTLKKIDDHEEAVKKDAQRTDLLDIGIQISRNEQRIVTLFSKSVKLGKTINTCNRSERSEAREQYDNLQSELYQEYQLKKQLKAVTDKYESNSEEVTESPKATKTQNEQLQNTVLKPVAKYKPKGKAGGDNQYYWYSYRSNGKVKHVHIPGGAVGSELVENRVKQINSMLHNGANHEEILNFIANCQTRTTKKAV